MTIETKRRVAKGLQLGLVVGVLVGLSGLIQTAWLADPIPALAQTVTVDSTQSPLVVNAVADLADLTPTDGQSVIIKTGAEKGLWYYDKDSATATSVSVLNGPGSVGRFLVINNDAGSVAAATAITAAEITDDGLLELQAFDGSSAKSLTLEELKKTGVQVVNAAQLGVDLTGIVDATAIISAAIAPNTILYVPPGSVSISSITIASEGFSIVGAPGASIVGSSAASIIIVSANKVSITGVEIDGNATAVKAIYISADAVNCTIDRCYIHDIAGSGATIDAIFFGEDVDGLRITNNRIESVYATDTSPARAIRGAGTTDPPQRVVISGNQIDNVYPVNDGDGIVIQNWTGNCGILITNNVLTRCAKRAIKIQSPGCLVSTNICTMSNVGGGADPYCGIALYDSNSLAANNIITGPCTFGGVAIGKSGGMSNAVVATNVINFGSHANASCDGIQTDAGAIAGMVVAGNSVSGTHRSGVRLAHACEGDVIVGNASSGASASAYMLSGAPTSTAIVGNTAFDHAHYLAHDNNAGTAVKTTIAGNASDSGGFGVVSATLLLDSMAAANGSNATTFSNNIIAAPYSLTNADATPSVYGQSRVKTVNAGATTITNFDDGVAGQMIDVIIDANTTIQHNATIKLNGGADFTPGANTGTLRLLNDAGVWKECGRAAF